MHCAVQVNPEDFPLCGASLMPWLASLPLLQVCPPHALLDSAFEIRSQCQHFQEVTQASGQAFCSPVPMSTPLPLLSSAFLRHMVQQHSHLRWRQSLRVCSRAATTTQTHRDVPALRGELVLQDLTLQGVPRDWATHATGLTSLRTLSLLGYNVNGSAPRQLYSGLTCLQSLTSIQVPGT